MHTFFRGMLASIGLFFFATHLFAQANYANFEVSAVFVEQAPRIDGYFDDDAWLGITPITQFTQVWPSDGNPATEKSEVRIAYDKDFLYFAFTFYDDNPELIRAKNLERGGRNDRDDHAYIALDTFLDGRNAYLFEMNALGTQDDATITDETITMNSFSWDAVFRSETVINDEGWTLEVSIPFRQLRFPDEEELTFGLMLSRTINRKNERVMWPDIGLEFGNFSALAAVSQYGLLTGIKNVNRGKNLEIKPYLITGLQEIREDLAVEPTDLKKELDLGLDVKYGLTSNLTLDLTANTDFAQVEDDNVQLNLTRFNLYYPEKREFFLERAGLFEHGSLRSTQTFFSRTIGLTNQILSGARMTGQVGNVSVGALNIETGDKMGEIFGPNSANNTVARVRTDIFKRTTVGAIFTNLEANGAYNRALGLDAQYRFGSSSSFRTWYTTVSDSKHTLSDAAGHASLVLRDDTFLGQLSYTNVGTNYAPALGFVRRKDMRQYLGRLGYSPKVTISSIESINRFNFEVLYNYIEGQNGEKQSTETEFTGAIEFSRRDQITFEFGQQFERLTSDFPIRSNAIISAGDYTFSQFTIRGSTDSSRRLFGNAAVTTGEFYDGDRTNISGGFGFRHSQHLTLEGNVSHSMIDLPTENGKFDASTVSMSVLGAVSRKLFARTLLQYDNFSRNFQANIRIDWIHTPGSDLFFVYNTSHHLIGSGENVFDPRRNLVMNNQVAIVKLTYLIML